MTVASLKELVCSQCGSMGPTDALPHRCPNCGADAAKLWVIDRATAAAPRRRQWGRGLALVIVLCLIPLATDDLDLSPPKRPKEPEIAANPGFAVVIPKPPPKQPKAQATASRPPDPATAAAEPKPAGAAAQKPGASPSPDAILGQPAAVQRLAASAGILAAVVLDPPDRTFADRAVIDLDGRAVELRYLGRGHTDNDIIVRIPDADVLCAGDER